MICFVNCISLNLPNVLCWIDNFVKVFSQKCSTFNAQKVVQSLEEQAGICLLDFPLAKNRDLISCIFVFGMLHVIFLLYITGFLGKLGGGVRIHIPSWGVRGTSLATKLSKNHRYHVVNVADDLHAQFIRGWADECYIVSVVANVSS